MSPSRPAPAARDPAAAATRSALLDAAAARFGRFGPRKTTMAEVAREAGLSRATVYTHFASKEDLYAALLERATERFVAGLEACIAGPGDAREKLRGVVGIAHRIYAQNPLLLGALSGDGDMILERVAARALRVHEERVIALLASVLAEGVRSGSLRRIDTEAVAYLMYQLGKVLVLSEVSGQARYPLRRILETMEDLLDRGLAKPVRRRGPGSSRSGPARASRRGPRDGA